MNRKGEMEERRSSNPGGADLGRHFDEARFGRRMSPESAVMNCHENSNLARKAPLAPFFETKLRPTWQTRSCEGDYEPGG
jgi:hypothetical protein